MVVLIIFPVILQTVINVTMLSCGGRGNIAAENPHLNLGDKLKFRALNLLCRKFAAVCQNSAGKLQHPATPSFFNPRHHWVSEWVSTVQHLVHKNAQINNTIYRNIKTYHIHSCRSLWNNHIPGITQRFISRYAHVQALKSPQPRPNWSETPLGSQHFQNYQ